MCGDLQMCRDFISQSSGCDYEKWVNWHMRPVNAHTDTGTKANASMHGHPKTHLASSVTDTADGAAKD